MVIVWLLFALAGVSGLSGIGSPKTAAPFFTPGMVLFLIIGAIVSGWVIGPLIDTACR